MLDVEIDSGMVESFDLLPSLDVESCDMVPSLDVGFVALDTFEADWDSRL